MRRGLAVLAAAGVSLALAVPASASQVEKGEHPFRYGTDISAWYWNRQVDQEATTPVGLPPPAPPVSQRVRLPNPQRPDTLPVAVFEAQHEKMAAIKFDLTERGVTPGSQIQKLTLRIEESIDHNEQPSYKPETAKLQACRVGDVLSPGENEQFTDRPQYSETDCAEGAREAPPAPAAPFWTFDLSEIAIPWGQDPYGNNGVMVLGVLQGGGSSETWQVNMKIPARDNASTANVDEYEQTKGRATLSLAFVPGEPAGGVDPGDAGTSTSPSTGTTGVPSSGVAPSTDLAGAGGFPAGGGTTSPTNAPPAPPTAPVAQVAPPQPRVPSFVWLLIPVGLLALSVVRSVVLEPVAGPRPDGAIAAILRRNAERRGGPLRVTGDPFARVAGAVVATGRAIRGAAAVTGRRVAGAARSLRRRR
jgi:hypothetical protein